MKTETMNRSANQALYKYIPESWADFYSKEDKTSYSTYIKAWNSKALDHVNKIRVIDEVKFNVEFFKENNGITEGFGAEIDEEKYEILTPKCIEDSDYSDIKSELSPLLFYCNTCKKVYTFSSRDKYNAFKRKGCTYKGCNGTLIQLRFVYTCGCGWTGPIRIKKCPSHDFDHIMYNGNYAFICKADGRKFEMTRKCGNCEKYLYPLNASDQKNTLPFSFTMIDFINTREEVFIGKEVLAPTIILARWLDIITEEEYQSILKLESLDEFNVEESEDYKRQYATFLDMFNDPIQAKKVALAACNTSKATTEIDQAKEFVETSIDFANQNGVLKRIATSYLEYRSILYRDKVLKLDEAAQLALEYNEILDKKEYFETSKKYGISNVQVSTDVPLLNCTYGYTRISKDPREYYTKEKQQLRLKAIKSEDGNKKNVYALSQKTEGVLIEFDKVKILKWLNKNMILDEGMTPNYNNKLEIDKWFINNIDLSAITRFSSIERDQNSLTHYVYTLLHTLSHALLKTAAQIAGLDANSLSEHVFPNNAAIFIYCQNEQGLNLGSLYSLLSMFFKVWIDNAFKTLEKCIFDPVCIERYHACLGCLYINEISCNHSNKDLNRGYVIGIEDDEEGKEINGFWEE